MMPFLFVLLIKIIIFENQNVRLDVSLKDETVWLSLEQMAELFGIERNHGLESILNDIYLTFDGKDVYESIELKACNFLYTLIKNHPFIDGNKRIAATLIA